MDLGICYIPANGGPAKFVGARVPLFHALPGQELVEYKGDRRGIGYRGISADQEFTVVELDRSPGTRFYLSSDGLFDQIGGERNRAFGKTRFLDALARVGDQPMADQCHAIEEAFAAYQAGERRRDDVTVVGFRT
jgi:serine phosphatase RsbU (regulator of sigma subunit)